MSDEYVLRIEATEGRIKERVKRVMIEYQGGGEEREEVVRHVGIVRTGMGTHSLAEGGVVFLCPER